MVNTNLICSVLSLILLFGLVITLINVEMGLIKNDDKGKNIFFSVFKVRTGGTQGDLSMFLDLSIFSVKTTNKLKNLICVLQITSLILFISVGISIVNFISNHKSNKNPLLITNMILIIIILSLVSAMRKEINNLPVKGIMESMEAFTNHRSVFSDLHDEFEFSYGYYYLIVLLFVSLVIFGIHNFKTVHKYLKNL